MCQFSTYVLVTVIILLYCATTKIYSRTLYFGDTNMEHVTHDKYPIITNLADILSLFGLQRCLIIVDNFRYVDLANSVPFPTIILSKCLLVLLDSSGIHRDDIIGPCHLSSRNFTVSENVSVLECTTSSYFQGMNLTDLKSKSFCTHMNTGRYVVYTKTWNCRVQIALHANTQFYQEYVQHTRFVDYVTDTISNTYFINPTELKYFMQIVVAHVGFTNSMLKELRRNDRNQVVFCGNFLFLVATFQVENENLSTAISVVPLEGKIVRMEVVGTCEAFPSFKIVIPFSPTGSIGFQKLYEMIFNTNLIWTIPSLELETESVFVLMLEEIYSCARFLSSRNTFVDTRPVEFVAHAYARVWFSIMENYTLVTTQRKLLCSTGFIKGYREILFEIPHVFTVASQYMKSSYHLPYFFHDEHSILRFVSCGKRGFTMFPFEELTSVFDVWIWLLLAVSMPLIIIPLWSCKGTTGKIWSDLMSPLKLFLEQGNPFQLTLETGQLQFTIALVLLMGIVLSNAYKNTNVYCMISPRVPVPYGYFQELIADRFTIYTRSVSLNLIVRGHGRFSKVQESSHTQLAPGPFYENQIVLFSEVGRLILSLENLAKSFQQSVIENTTLEKSGIANVSIFHPWTHATFFDMGMTWKGTEFEIFRYLHEFLKNKVRWLQKNEATFLATSLHECNKVAVVLPEYLSKIYWRNLRRDGKIHAFVGKDAISDIDWMFKLYGLVPSRVHLRFQTVHEAGIWERWWKLLRRSTDNTEVPPVVAASMSGNVVVIFCVWCVGLALSLAASLLEFTLRHLICL